MSEATFASTGIRGPILDVLKQRSIITPTPIQDQAIPVLLAGNDLIGIAQTGTGKTLAFVLPILQRLIENPGRLLIVVPTRELAFQVEEVCRWFVRVVHIYSTVIIGGASMQQQISALQRKPQIIVATPGRLIDHLEHKTVELHTVNYVVLDEADRMFDMGFAPQIQTILKHLPDTDHRQTALFSATMPPAIGALVRKYMHTPVQVEIATSGTTASGVKQEMIIIDKQHQESALLELLAGKKEAMLIFTRTKYKAKALTRRLRDKGYHVEELHSNRSLFQRKQAVAAVQSKRSQILVATDIAARGIDIAHLGMVINYDLPDNPEDYVHRIGRTGRAGRIGRAISFVLSDQGQEIRKIQQLIDVQIEQIHLTEVPSGQLSTASSSGNRRRSFSGGTGGRNSRRPFRPRGR